jgi:hypothetical protein
MDFESSGSEFDPRREHSKTGDQLFGLLFCLNHVCKYCLSLSDCSPYAYEEVHMVKLDHLLMSSSRIALQTNQLHLIIR